MGDFDPCAEYVNQQIADRTGGIHQRLNETHALEAKILATINQSIQDDDLYRKAKEEGDRTGRSAAQVLSDKLGPGQAARANTIEQVAVRRYRKRTKDFHSAPPR
jgi:hypothetical protein